jgi:hypothetical protein
MANCEACGNALRFFENLRTIGSAKRCDACIARFNQICDDWLQKLQTQFDQQGVTNEAEEAVLRGLQEACVPTDLGNRVVERMRYLRHLTFKQICNDWLKKLQTQFDQQGVTSETEEILLRNLQEARVPTDLGNPVVERMRYLRHLSEIRWGNLPVIHAPMHLDSDETAHFSMSATYHKPLKRVKIISGQIIGTNKKFYFQSASGADSHVIDWNNVSRVDEKQIITVLTQKVRTSGGTITETKQMAERGIQISVTKGSGGGEYVVGDPLLAKTFIDTLVRLWKRQLVIYQEQKTHGAVPEHVKVAVRQRDKGRCVQCGSDADGGKYLEYDHIIPRSKGGPNTVENIQLLCRMCNLRKGDRI